MHIIYIYPTNTPYIQGIINPFKITVNSLLQNLHYIVTYSPKLGTICYIYVDFYKKTRYYYFTIKWNFFLSKRSFLEDLVNFYRLLLIEWDIYSILVLHRAEDEKNPRSRGYIVGYSPRKHHIYITYIYIYM